MADANISLYFNGNQQQHFILNTDARLDTLLKNSQIPQNIYWRSAQIATPEQYKVIIQQQSILLSELQAIETWWRNEGESKNADSAAKVYQQIAQLQLSGRLPITLDPYQIQRSTADNPRLEGQYQLYLAPRPSQIVLLGLIQALPTLSIEPGLSIDQYWQRNALQPSADTAHVWLIQPTGHIEQVPVAVWNKLEREPMPGATLLVGFDEGLLPTRFEGINRRIAEIITNKVPK
ncbi:MAG: capsule biosynthesis GfcC D2 domain-containing protein [Plesiomonas sp.]|uniref:capsule biosynthesis GfcC D2 domain-containing protein n=1 Tax=Plesiomonas sp. TaxID=2486279 RepID=UPI003F3AB341